MPHSETSRQVNFCLDEDALRLLEQFVPRGPHKKGRFISRLIYEHAVRVEERQWLGERRGGGVNDADAPAP